MSHAVLIGVLSACAQLKAFYFSFHKTKVFKNDLHGCGEKDYSEPGG